VTKLPTTTWMESHKTCNFHIRIKNGMTQVSLTIIRFIAVVSVVVTFDLIIKRGRNEFLTQTVNKRRHPHQQKCILKTMIVIEIFLYNKLVQQEKQTSHEFKKSASHSTSMNERKCNTNRDWSTEWVKSVDVTSVGLSVLLLGFGFIRT